MIKNYVSGYLVLIWLLRKRLSYWGKEVCVHVVQACLTAVMFIDQRHSYARQRNEVHHPPFILCSSISWSLTQGFSFSNLLICLFIPPSLFLLCKLTEVSPVSFFLFLLCVWVSWTSTHILSVSFDKSATNSVYTFTTITNVIFQ